MKSGRFIAVIAPINIVHTQTAFTFADNHIRIVDNQQVDSDAFATRLEFLTTLSSPNRLGSL